MLSVSNRKPKFRRVAPAKLPMLTERDLNILELLSRYRFLNADHIRLLIAGSDEGIGRRLQLLFHAGYVDRPAAQLEVFKATENHAYVYAIGKDGAKALVEHNKREKMRSDWTTRNKTITKPAVRHFLAIADVMSGFEHYADKDFLSQYALLNEKGDKLTASWQTEILEEGKPMKIRVIPDQFFGVDFGPNAKSYFFLEADKGSMPIRRSGPRQTSLMQKVQAYLASNSGKIPQEVLGIKHWRVIFVVPSLERQKNLQQAIQDTTKGQGAGLFLIATYDALKCKDPRNFPFINGRGEQVIFNQE